MGSAVSKSSSFWLYACFYSRKWSPKGLHVLDTKHSRLSGRCEVPVLKYVPHHEDVQWNVGITSRILNVGIRWRWVVSFTPRPLYPAGRTPGTHRIQGWVGPSAGLDAVAKRKIPCPSREKNRPTRCTVTIWRYSGSCNCKAM